MRFRGCRNFSLDDANLTQPSEMVSSLVDAIHNFQTHERGIPLNYKTHCHGGKRKSKNYLKLFESWLWPKAVETMIQTNRDPLRLRQTF